MPTGLSRLQAPTEPVLPLCYSSAELFDPVPELSPDTAAWSDASNDELDDPPEPLAGELGIPDADHRAPLSTKSWNLGAAAAAFVPLLLCADPALAAPPSSEATTAPRQDPPPAVPTSIWAGLAEHRVALTMADGSSFRGTVLSATDEALACAREGDGLMVLVKIAEISYVHVEGLPGTPAAKPPQTGQGLIVLGSIATTIGGALAIATAATAGACGIGYGYVCPYYTLPLGIASVVNLGVGIPFLAAGLSKRKRYRAAQREAASPSVSAFVLPGKHGIMGGVGVRF